MYMCVCVHDFHICIHLSVLSPFFLVNTSSLFVLIIPTVVSTNDDPYACSFADETKHADFAPR